MEETLEDVKTAPLISIKVKSERENNTRITAEVKDLFSEPMIKVRNKVTKKSNKIPLEFAIELNPTLFKDVEKELRGTLSKERRKLYNPKDLMQGLLYGEQYYPAVKKTEPKGFGRISAPGFYFDLNSPKTIILEKDAKHEVNQKYIPYLAWRDENLNDGITDGWDLYLSGFDDLPIASAEWSNEGEIRKLANLLFEVEDLKAMLALLRPDESIIISSLATSESVFAKCRRIGVENDRNEILSFLENSKTLTSHYTRGEHLQIDGLVLDGYQIAHGINIPYTPRSCAPAEPSSILLRHKRNKAIKSERRAYAVGSVEERDAFDKLIQVQWVNALAIEAIKNGWRIIEPWGPSQTNYNPWLWITKLSVEDWSAIAPAMEAAEVDSRRPAPNWG